MKHVHLPSVDALTAPDDHRLLKELEISSVLERLARIRALIDRTDRLLLAEAVLVDKTTASASESSGGGDLHRNEDPDLQWGDLIASIRRLSGL